MTYNALYSVESGASKKRKKDNESDYWNSLNGPVIQSVVKDKEVTDDRQ